MSASGISYRVQVDRVPITRRIGRAALQEEKRHGLLAALALLLAPLAPIHLALPATALAVAVPTGIAAARAGSWPVLRLAVFGSLLALSSLTGIPSGIWVGVLLIWLASLRFRDLAPTGGWLKAGDWTPQALWLAAITVIAAAVVLTVWALNTSSFGGSTEELVASVRDLPLLVLVIGGVGFVAINAVAEEIAYRGFAYEAAINTLPPVAAIAVQGAAFGAVHIAGFPAGLLGVALATAYGVTLGALRYMTGGMRLPILVHIAADATIATLFITVLVK